MSIYSDDMLALAADRTHVGLPPTATVRGRWANPLCGDAIEVAAEIREGRFQAVGFEAQACAVCVGSAAAMCRELDGQPVAALHRVIEGLEMALNGDASDLQPGLRALMTVAPFRSRHSCVLLPWRALEQALSPAAPAADTSRPQASSIDPGERSPWRVALDLVRAGHRAAIATLISVEGSSPCPVGARMVVSSTGDFWGSVSGGCVESAVVGVAVELMLSGDQPSQLLEYQISNSQAGEVGLPCGGRIEVLVGRAPALDELERRASVAEPVFCRTSLTTGESALCDGQYLAELGISLATDEAGRVVQTDEGPVFVESLVPAERLVLVGGTEIAQKLARLASELGYDVVVVDPRTALGNRERFGGFRIVNAPVEVALPGLLLPTTSVVMLTHDRAIDDPALEIALRSDARYVAALGSRKTQKARLERLAAAGLSPDELARLRGPAGLAIGAVGAGEIALSILAEIVAERRAATSTSPRVAAVLLAAGASRRAGPTNKLLHLVDGVPMVRKVAQTALEAGLAPCIVVLGHEAERVREVLSDLPVRFVLNERYAEGMGTSVAAGIAALEDVDAALILLGDMPLVRAGDLEKLIAAHQPSTSHLIIAPEAGPPETRRLGNPVLWPRRYFRELAELRGDTGGKHILLRAPGAVLRIGIDHPGVLQDFDTVPDSEHLPSRPPKTEPP